MKQTTKVQFPFKTKPVQFIIGIAVLSWYVRDLYLLGPSPTRSIMTIGLFFAILLYTNIFKLAKIIMNSEELLFISPLGIKYKSLKYDDIKWARLHSDRLYILKKDKRHLQIKQEQIAEENLQKIYNGLPTAIQSDISME
jgi:hypothetical protein